MNLSLLSASREEEKKGDFKMKENIVPVTSINPTTIILGILAAGLVFAVLTGRRVPLISSERVALIVLVVLGMAMCTNGIGRVAAANAWRIRCRLSAIYWER
jgi:hypothetical protein